MPHSSVSHGVQGPSFQTSPHIKNSNQSDDARFKHSVSRLVGQSQATASLRFPLCPEYGTMLELLHHPSADF